MDLIYGLIVVEKYINSFIHFLHVVK